MRNKIFNKNILPIILVIMVILNYLPLIVLNCTIKSSKAAGISTLVPAFGIGFVYLFFFYIKKVKITKPMVIEFVLLFLITIMWSTVQIINYKSGNYYLNDIIGSYQDIQHRIILCEMLGGIAIMVIVSCFLLIEVLMCVLKNSSRPDERNLPQFFLCSYITSFIFFYHICFLYNWIY